MTNNIPQELNWVEKGASCKVDEVFNRLCGEIEEDVKAVNAILRKELFFRSDYVSDGSIVVGQPARIPRMTVRVGIVDGKILVMDNATSENWSARVGLNDEGRCVLKLESGTEMETWQFRKKALESLFFDVRGAVL